MGKKLLNQLEVENQKALTRIDDTNSFKKDITEKTSTNNTAYNENKTEYKTVSLLSDTTRVEIPIIKVTIGEHTFGVYKKTSAGIQFPNYIKSLAVKKINGKVNEYTLRLVYPITPKDDPNYFEKVFASVSKDRKIVLTYGDASMPSFIYKSEEAIITGVKSSLDFKSSVLSYDVTAVSSFAAASAGAFDFPAATARPSDIIKKLIREDSKWHLTDIFTGMKNYNKVLKLGLILSDDKQVHLDRKVNISLFDYLAYLIASMTCEDDNQHDGRFGKASLYTFVVIDDTTGELGGTYFKIIKVGKKVSNAQNYFETYSIDIGYPNETVVTEFQIEQDNNYTILYDYAEKVSDMHYRIGIDDEGHEYYEYAPVISSNNDEFRTTEAGRTWWTSVTAYPISISLVIRGLLRPAILMTYVRLNVYFYGKKHISSGLYFINQQLDTIDENGYRTQLRLKRISGDSDEDYVV